MRRVGRVHGVVVVVPPPGVVPSALQRVEQALLLTAPSPAPPPGLLCLHHQRGAFDVFRSPLLRPMPSQYILRTVALIRITTQ